MPISTSFSTSQLDRLSAEVIIEIMFNISSLTRFCSLSCHAMKFVNPSASTLQSFSRVKQSRCQHLFVACRWHSPRGLHIWGIKENSFHRRSVPVSARERVLMSTIHSYQRKASTLQRCINNPTASSFANHSSTSELDDDNLCEADDLAELRSGNEERKMGTREWRRHQRIPQGSVENGVTRICVCPLVLFINTQIYYAARPHSSKWKPARSSPPIGFQDRFLPIQCQIYVTF